MTRKIVVILIFLFLTYHHCYAEEQNTDYFHDYFEKALRLGWLGLSYCMQIDDEETINNELEMLSKHPYKNINIMDSKAVFEELKRYIDGEKNFYNISENNKKRGYTNFKGCLRMYYYGTGFGTHYNEEVNRIVKKYCKECE